MQIGKLENASASYIDPTAKAMRASADSASQGKADVTSIPAQSQAEDKPNTAAELLESNGVYKLDISEEGQALAAMEKKTLADNEKVALVVNGNGDDMTVSVLKDGEITNVVNCTQETKEDFKFTWTWETRMESASLANNMSTIEKCIADGFKYAQNKDGKHHYLWAMQGLGQALNAYRHKQSEALARGKDEYLTGLLNRLDQLGGGKSNPVLWQMQSMVYSAIKGQDIDVHLGPAGDKFVDEVLASWDKYQFCMETESSDIESKRKPDEAFNTKFAIYSYMQVLARLQAEQEENLIDGMLGDGDEQKELRPVGEILNSSLEDGMVAWRYDCLKKRNVVRVEGDKVVALTPEEQAEENKKIEPSVTGYDWEVISQKYLSENPDVAEIMASIENRY